MPELPEVETILRGMQPLIDGCVFQSVDIMRRDLRGGVPDDFEARVTGRRVVRSVRRGKYMLFFLEGPDVIVWHLGMSGRVRLYRPDQDLDSQKHDHVIFTMKGGARIVFQDPRRFGMMYVMRSEGWFDQKPFAAMGPEPLEDDFIGDVLMQRLAKKRAAIKVALLDQRVVVGVGNIYACEALFRARISPFVPAGSLTRAQCDNLVVCIKDVLRAAIASGGSSLRDYKQADGQMGYFQHHFDVYGRAGEKCGAPACAHDKAGCVERVVQAGRSTFYCPRVQEGCL